MLVSRAFALCFVTLALASCDKGTWFGYTAPGANTPQCAPGLDLYVGNVERSAQVPGSLIGMEVILNQFAYGCGQVICSASMSAARDVFGGAVGVAGGNASLFVYDLGSTGQSAHDAEPAAASAWLTAGGVCLGADAGASPWAQLGQVCYPVNPPPDKRCCAGLVCDANAAPSLCCYPTGAECSSSADCCSTDLCESNGFADVCCRTQGTLCDPSNDNCCSGWTCALYMMGEYRCQ